ncbi:MAG: hypothetical protein AABX05_05230 [Nanoarchaeota archaeon]
MIDDLFSKLAKHTKKYVIDRVPDPFLGEGITFKPMSDRLVLATAIFDAKMHAELSAANINLEYLAAGGIANYYGRNPLPNTCLQIEIVGFGELSPESRMLELNLKMIYFAGPRIIASDGFKMMGNRQRHPPTTNYRR